MRHGAQFRENASKILGSTSTLPATILGRGRQGKFEMGKEQI